MDRLLNKIVTNLVWAIKMKNTAKGILITGAIVGGGILLYSGENSKTVPHSRDDDYETTRSYEEYGDRDCADFSAQNEAQEFFEEQGGPDEDFHNLDRDGDGIVCENL